MKTERVFLTRTISRKWGLKRGYHDCAHERENDYIMLDDSHNFWSVPKKLIRKTADAMIKERGE